MIYAKTEEHKMLNLNKHTKTKTNTQV